jgi:hypothetical protein
MDLAAAPLNYRTALFSFFSKSETPTGVFIFKAGRGRGRWGTGTRAAQAWGGPKRKRKTSAGHYTTGTAGTVRARYSTSRIFGAASCDCELRKPKVALFGAFGIFWGVEVLCQGQGESAILLFTVPVRLYLCNIIFGCTVQCWYNSGRVVLRLNSILAPRGINFASNFHDSKSNIKSTSY